MDAADLKLFDNTLREIAASDSVADLDAALERIGWRDALADAPAIAAILFDVQGELCLQSSAIDDVVMAALDLEPSPTTSVVLPAIGSHTAPGTVTGDRVVVRGVASRRMLDAREVALAVGGSDGGGFVMSVAAGDLGRRPVSGVDPDAGWVVVTGEIAAPPPAGRTLAPWSAAVIAGQLAVGSELVANSRAMLGLARDHAVERVQFGVPIASFQAVRHRLADARYAVDSADAAVTSSWEAPSGYAAAMAKAIAGRSAKTVARHAQQVLAGMGFTSEHRFHRYFKRSLVLDQLFGSSAALSEAIGAEVLRTKTLPPVRPL